MCGGQPNQRMVQCGRCGFTQHVSCLPRKPAPCYWYCAPCAAAIEAAGGPQDITEDIPAQLHLLGGARPASYTEEAAQNLRAFFTFRRGQLMIECSEGYRVYPTAYMRSHLIEEYHHSHMHAGWRATAEALKSRYHWPSLEADTKAYCRSCLACQLETAVFPRQDVLSGHLSASS